MPQLARTTITLPEDLLYQLKIKSITENSSVSHLIVDVVKKSLYQTTTIKAKKEPLETLGKFKLGAKKIYSNRDELYKNQIKRKMGD